MRLELEDIAWRGQFAEALAEAAQMRRAVVVKPTGQGFDPSTDEW